nr:cysteine desulfurase [Clostridiales bacterium]
EIYFTSGGTESDNWALKGYLKPGDHVITTNIEHHAILNTLKDLETTGIKVTYVPVECDGRVNPEKIDAAITGKTKLITVMAANNEIGTIQPIREIYRITREAGIAFHTDAVQAYGQTNVSAYDCDMLSVSAHKFHGPKGVGFLFVKDWLKLKPMITGGAQQNGMRGGTLNVPGIMGMAKAAELAQNRNWYRMVQIRDYAIRRLMMETDAVLNGSWYGRLANNINVSFPGFEAETIIAYLELHGIHVSGGSACTADQLEPSHVIRAIGREDALAKGSIRITTSRHTTLEEMKYTLDKVDLAVCLQAAQTCFSN